MSLSIEELERALMESMLGPSDWRFYPVAIGTTKYHKISAMVAPPRLFILIACFVFCLADELEWMKN